MLHRDLGLSMVFFPPPYLPTIGCGEAKLLCACQEEKAGSKVEGGSRAADHNFMEREGKEDAR